MYGSSPSAPFRISVSSRAENAAVVFPAYGVPLYLAADCLLLSRNL
jgi:hypothetical protein